MAKSDSQESLRLSSMGGQKSSRVLYFDILNVAACLAVIFIHHNGLAHHFSPSSSWVEAMVIECVAYWAVPVFFMLSGATLLEYKKRYSTRDFFKKRIRRSLIPFIAWSVLGYAWKVTTGQMRVVGARSFLSLVLNSQIIDVYWFFIPLFGLYLAYPLLAEIVEKVGEKYLWYGVGLYVVFNATLPMIAAMLGVKFNPDIKTPIFFSYMIYPILGYLLSRRSIGKRERRAIYLLGAVALLLKLFVTVILSLRAQKLYTVFFNYQYITTILLATAVFVLAKQTPWERVLRTNRAIGFLRALSSCSLGIYMIHRFVQFYLRTITQLPVESVIWRLGVPLFTYAICLLIVHLCKKIPVINEIIP